MSRYGSGRVLAAPEGGSACRQSVRPLCDGPAARQRAGSGDSAQSAAMCRLFRLLVLSTLLQTPVSPQPAPPPSPPLRLNQLRVQAGPLDAEAGVGRDTPLLRPANLSQRAARLAERASGTAGPSISLLRANSSLLTADTAPRRRRLAARGLRGVSQAMDGPENLPSSASSAVRARRAAEGRLRANSLGGDSSAETMALGMAARPRLGKAEARRHLGSVRAERRSDIRAERKSDIRAERRAERRQGMRAERRAERERASEPRE